MRMLLADEAIRLPKDVVYMRVGNFSNLEPPYWDRFFPNADIIMPVCEGQDGLTDEQLKHLRHTLKSNPSWSIGLDCFFADPVNRKKVFDVCREFGRPVVGIHVVGGQPYHPDARLFRHPARPTPNQENFHSIYELDLSGGPRLIWSKT